MAPPGPRRRAGGEYTAPALLSGKMGGARVMKPRPFDQIVLSYHTVCTGWPSPLAVSENVLAQQLSLLKSRGYQGLTFSEWEIRLDAGELPPRAVVVSFDDGYASTLNAVPILKETGYPGTVFPVVSFIESGEPLSWPGISHWRGTEHERRLTPLAWGQLEELREAGWEIGSHTLSHPNLIRCDDASLREELERSRKTIAARLGKCETIAYPYGSADERVAAAAALAGYRAGCTLSRFHRVNEPLRRPRIALFAEDSGMRLRLKVSRFASAVRGSRLIARMVDDGEEPLLCDVDDTHDKVQ
jgi:peptidoglycan/xylan/chitin deacetylase (PgdA/CDA1 family)